MRLRDTTGTKRYALLEVVERQECLRSDSCRAGHPLRLSEGAMIDATYLKGHWTTNGRVVPERRTTCKRAGRNRQLLSSKLSESGP